MQFIMVQRMNYISWAMTDIVVRFDAQEYFRSAFSFYQRVSIASYASAGIARGGMSVCLSVCPSVCHTPVLYENEES